MPAILKIVYNVAPTVDMSSVDPVGDVVNVMQQDLTESVSNSLAQQIEQAVTNGHTQWESSQNTLDRGNKTMTIERQFTTLEAANAHKTWIESNVPASTANFTLTSITVTDNAELLMHGPTLI